MALTCVEIKILRRVRAESSRRPPRHRRDACSMAWRCRFLAARRSQHGRVIVEKCAPDTLVDFHTGEHHNVQTTRAYDCDCENPNPTVADIVGGAWEWMSGFRGWCAGDHGDRFRGTGPTCTATRRRPRTPPIATPRALGYIYGHPD